MINYEKLKLAHELANTYAKKYKQAVSITYHQYTYEDYPSNFRLNIFGGFDEVYLEIDDLIAKLQEITQIKPKYQIGQKVFCLSLYSEVCEAEILELSGSDSIQYLVQFPDSYRAVFKEENIYPTKKQLINAQIDYWIDLKIKEISTGSDDVSMECTHESDDDEKHIGFWPDSDLATIKMKCKKCGEFYK